MFKKYYRNLARVCQACSRPSEVLEPPAVTCSHVFPFQEQGSEKMCFSSGGRWRKLAAHWPRCGGWWRDSQDQCGHNRPWWVLLTGTGVWTSQYWVVTATDRGLGLFPCSLPRRAPWSSWQELWGDSPELCCVCLCMHAHVCVFLVVKAKPEMDSQMVKKTRDLFRDYCKKERDLSMEVESVINKHEQVGICTQGAGIGGLLDGKLLRRNIRDQSGFLAKPIWQDSCWK